MKSIKNILYITLLITLFIKCGEEKPAEITNPKEEINSETEMITVTSKQFKNANMELGLPVEYAFSTGVKTTGAIDVPPQSKAVISSFAAGRVKNVVLLVGDKVKEGQPLVTIENMSFIELQQSYLEVAEQIEYLKAEYERQKELFKEKIASQKIFLKSESDYKTMNSKYIGMKRKLQLLNINTKDVEEGKLTSTITIYSPISGSISTLNVSSGSYISPTDVIMEVINTDHIHVELNVFEKDAVNVKKGQKILFKVSESSSQIYEAEVHLVGTSINQETRTVKIHGHINQQDQPHFLAGMFVDAEILTHGYNSMALPAEAIIEKEDKKVALVLKEHKNERYVFQEKEVKAGQILNGFVKVENSKDFNKKDTLLIKGGYSLVNIDSGGHSH